MARARSDPQLLSSAHHCGCIHRRVLHRAQYRQPAAPDRRQRADQPGHADRDPDRRHRPQRRFRGGAGRRVVRRPCRQARHSRRARGRGSRGSIGRPHQRHHHLAFPAATLHRHAGDDGHHPRRGFHLHREPAVAAAREFSRSRRGADRPGVDRAPDHAGCYLAASFFLNRTRWDARPWRSAAMSRRCGSPA